MKAFISWSKEQSKEVARALHGWLPLIFDTVAPWMSDRDIYTARCPSDGPRPAGSGSGLLTPWTSGRNVKPRGGSDQTSPRATGASANIDLRDLA